MDKLNYQKELLTESDEQISLETYDNDNNIYIRSDDKQGYAIAQLTRQEAQRLKRYLEDAITTNIINWEEE